MKRVLAWLGAFLLTALAVITGFCESDGPTFEEEKLNERLWDRVQTVHSRSHSNDPCYSLQMYIRIARGEADRGFQRHLESTECELCHTYLNEALYVIDEAKVSRRFQSRPAIHS